MHVLDSSHYALYQLMNPLTTIEYQVVCKDNIEGLQDVCVAFAISKLGSVVLCFYYYSQRKLLLQ